MNKSDVLVRQPHPEKLAQLNRRFQPERRIVHGSRRQNIRFPHVRRKREAKQSFQAFRTTIPRNQPVRSSPAPAPGKTAAAGPIAASLKPGRPGASTESSNRHCADRRCKSLYHREAVHPARDVARWSGNPERPALHQPAIQVFLQ